MSVGKITILVMIDFTQAFNSIKRETILEYCRLCNFSDEAIVFMYSYLCARSFYISDPNQLYPLTSGISQGTGPGPILYIGGTNSIATRVRTSLFKLFVDDDDIYQHCFVSDAAATIRSLNDDLANIEKWSSEIGIDININKTQAMVLGTNYNLQKFNKLILPAIVIKNKVIPFANNCKNLGAYITNDLTWNVHTSNIISKVNSALINFYKKTKCLPIKVKIMLACQLLLPHFDYACVVYDDLSDYLNARLQVLQNQCIRFIFGLNKQQHITPYRTQLKWLTTKGRRRYLFGCLIYKLLKTKKPQYLFELLEQHFSYPVRELRSAEHKTFDIPFDRSTIFDRTFQFRATSLWNFLPNKVTESDTIAMFKKRLFKFIFDNEKNSE